MAKPTSVRFCVLSENQERAIAHLTERGYPPLRVERDEDGLSALILPSVPDDQLFALGQAIPKHLSAKVAIAGAAFPFRAESREGH
ncbi:MAG: hypothetical protein JNL35_12420 [Sphingopyxis sp.]|nr:hypothetical protein [Sphingopyxis sp.]